MLFFFRLNQSNHEIIWLNLLIKSACFLIDKTGGFRYKSLGFCKILACYCPIKIKCYLRRHDRVSQLNPAGGGSSSATLFVLPEHLTDSLKPVPLVFTFLDPWGSAVLRGRSLLVASLALTQKRRCQRTDVTHPFPCSRVTERAELYSKYNDRVP
jgi:hypothetical protein